MLSWAVTFLIIALIAALLGFGGIAAASAGIAKFLFFLFLMIKSLFFSVFLILALYVPMRYVLTAYPIVQVRYYHLLSFSSFASFSNASLSICRCFSLSLFI